MPIPLGSFADVQEVSFEPLPAGKYEVSVFEAELKEAGPNAKHPGSQYIAFTFNVTEEGDYQNRKLWHNVSLVPEARGMLKSFLKVFYTEEELNSDDFEFEPENLIGSECIAVVRVGTNPNTQEPNNSVRRIEKVGESESSDLPV
jgi:hypothetical protein